MRTLIIMNPAAGSSGTAGALRDKIAADPEISLRETSDAGQAAAIVREAIDQGYELIAAAGGDGTVNEVVQGFASAAHAGARARLGLIPLGTGNDLARTLGVPLNPIEALELLGTGQERVIDLIRVDTDLITKHCVNVCAGGFSGQIDEVLTDEMKARWGPLSYLSAAAMALPDLTGYTTSLAYDEEEPESILAFNVIVANGKTCGGGTRVAPLAELDDGLIDVVVVRYGSLLDLASVAARLLTGNYLNSEDVIHRRARRVRVASKPGGMWFNVDGELLTKEPVTFSVVPRALRVIAGPVPAPAES